MLKLLEQGGFKRSMAAEVALEHVDNVLGEELKSPTAWKLTALAADLVHLTLEEDDHHNAALLVKHVMDLTHHAAARDFADELLENSERATRPETFALVDPGPSLGLWCAREGERDAILLSLVKTLGVRRAQQVIREVALLKDSALTATQWHTYITRQEDFEGIPANMWVKLI